MKIPGIVPPEIKRRQGTLKRLRLAPLTRGQIILGKLLPCYAVSVGQGALLLILGKWIGVRRRGPRPAAGGWPARVSLAVAGGVGVPALAPLRGVIIRVRCPPALASQRSRTPAQDALERIVMRHRACFI